MTGSPPAVYNGRYELRSQVARGGTAQVYLARDLLLDRPVALKVLDPQLSTDHAFVERFRREAQAAANLSHPNIVPVFDWGESDRTYFIVMEYVDGEPLSSIIRTQAPIPPEQAASIASDIAKALTYAHRHGVVHRDVKPGNVLITSDGQVKVTDFGIARAIGADEQVTQTGLVMGTATYFSPEQAQGLGVDGRSDLYALGVVLYEMVTGRPPFTGDTPVSIAYQHVREVPPTPRSLNPSVPPPLEAIILQAMAKLPAERYATAEDMRADLDRFVRHQTVLARPPSEFAGVLGAGAATTAISSTQINQAIRKAPRRRTTTPYWVAAAVVLLAGLAAAVVFGGRSLGYFGATHYFAVPDVRGMAPAQAEAKLHSKGLRWSIGHQVQGTVADSNTVVSQSPAYPNTTKAGSTVVLTVATKAPTAQVPNVLNMAYKDAATQLSAAGFVAKQKDVSPTSSSQVDNQVIAESPTAVTVEPKGSTVTLSVVQTKNVPVPPLANLTQAQAGAALANAKLTLGTQTQQYSSSVTNGDVISSQPAANTSTPQGTAVNLIISEGPGATVPNVVGLSLTDAQNAIRANGLTPQQGKNIGTSDPADVNNVAAQHVLGSSATPGQQVAPNSTVIYRMGVGTGPLASTTTTVAGNSGNTGLPGSTTTSTLPVSGAGPG